MVGERRAAGGQAPDRRAAARRRSSGAAPSPPSAGVEILAERGGERALVAGRGLDMVDRAVAARRLDRLEQRLRLGLQRGQSGAGGGGLAFGGVARGGGLLARGLGGGDRLAGRGERALRPARAAVARRLERGSSRPASPPSPAICSAIRPASASARASFWRARVERGLGDPRLGLLGGLDRAGLAERGLGGARLVLMLDGADVDRAAPALGLGEPRGDRRQLLLEPGDGGGGVVAQRLLAQPVGGEGAAALVELGDPAADAVALGAQRGELVAERGGALARRLGGLAAGRRASAAASVCQAAAARCASAARADRGLGGLGFRPAPPRPPRPPRASGRRSAAPRRSGSGRRACGSARRRAPGASARAPRSSMSARISSSRIRLASVGAQLLLGVLAADVEAGDPGRLLEHQPALGRLGGDHRADLALADQSRANGRRSRRRRTARRRPSGGRRGR